jgi:hypothetical protein
VPHRLAIDEVLPGERTRTTEEPAPASPALDVLGLQRSAGNAAVARAIAARQATAAPTATPEAELEEAFFGDDWDRVVVLAAPRSSPGALERIAGLDADELRYLDDAISRAGQERSWLAKAVKSAFGAKKVPAAQQAAGAGYGKLEFKNTFATDGSAGRPRRNAKYGFEITFQPNPPTMGSADEIGFIQSVRTVDIDTGANRGANGRDRLASDMWHVDRLDGMDQGWYGMSDEGGSSGKHMRLWEKSDWEEPASMRDVPSVSKGNVEFHAETAIVCRKGFHAGKVYATVHWGFEVNHGMVVTPYETEVFNKESEAFRDAVDAWNAQATGPEAKRGGDNQHTLPTNFR